MIQFTERSGDLFQLVLYLALSTTSAIRISATRRGPGGDAVSLELAPTSEFRPSDELVLAPGGVPVFIEPDLAPVLEGSVIDGTLAQDGRPNITVHKSERSRRHSA